MHDASPTASLQNKSISLPPNFFYINVTVALTLSDQTDHKNPTQNAKLNTATCEAASI